MQQVLRSEHGYPWSNTGDNTVFNQTVDTKYKYIAFAEHPLRQLEFLLPLPFQSDSSNILYGNILGVHIFTATDRKELLL